MAATATSSTRLRDWSADVSRDGVITRVAIAVSPG
jgi:hypothetical protein